MKSMDVFHECLTRCTREDEMQRLLREYRVLCSTGVWGKIEDLYRLWDLFRDGPFFLRGSAGGSLVLYLLGFTEFHPIDHGLLFERFVASTKSVGDIDIDVVPEQRPGLFRALAERFPGRVGRLSNRNYYREKSALRRLLRDELALCTRRQWDAFSGSVSEDQLREWKQLAQERYVGRFRHYSKHVGGVVVFDDPLVARQCVLSRFPEYLPQLLMDKYDIEKEGLFKMDLLNNHALGFLRSIDPTLRRLFDVKTDPRCADPLVFRMIQGGDTLGVLHGESPLLRRCFRVVRPKTIQEIGLCFALIRPMNRRFRDQILRGRSGWKDHRGNCFFDDDWIRQLAQQHGISLEEAELRRKTIRKSDRAHAMKGYGFCRAHALHYGLLIYTQCWHKYHRPLLFYRELMHDTQRRRGARMFAPWVYVLDALRRGIFFTDASPCQKKNSRPRWKMHPRRANALCPTTGTQSRLAPVPLLKQIEHTGMFASSAGMDVGVLDRAVAHSRIDTRGRSLVHYFDAQRMCFDDAVVDHTPQEKKNGLLFLDAE